MKRSISGTRPDRADRDRRRTDRRAVRAAQQVGRRHHAVVVQERLAHPHEDRPGDPPPLRADQLARLDELVDHLPGLEVAPARHPRRRAEDAAHRAADLRRQADAHRPRLVQAGSGPSPPPGRRPSGTGASESRRPPRSSIRSSAAGAAGRRIASAAAAGPGNRAPQRAIMDAPTHHRREQPADRQVVGPEGPGAAWKAPGVRSRGSSTGRFSAGSGIDVDEPAHFLKYSGETVPARVEGRRRSVAGPRSARQPMPGITRWSGGRRRIATADRGSLEAGRIRPNLLNISSVAMKYHCAGRDEGLRPRRLVRPGRIMKSRRPGGREDRPPEGIAPEPAVRSSASFALLRGSRLVEAE